MEEEILNAVKAQIALKVPEVNFVHMWNNQVEKIKEVDENGNPYYLIHFPAVFVEYTTPNEILQLGNGNQIYDPLDIRIHIVHVEIDSMDGNMEENVNVFALKKNVYKALQNFEPDGCCAWSRINEEQDYDHNNVYHYIQTFRTNYVDCAMSQPVDGIAVDPQSIDLNITTEIVESLE